MPGRADRMGRLRLGRMIALAGERLGNLRKAGLRVVQVRRRVGRPAIRWDMRMPHRWLWRASRLVVAEHCGRGRFRPRRQAGNHRFGRLDSLGRVLGHHVGQQLHKGNAQSRVQSPRVQRSQLAMRPDLVGSRAARERHLAGDRVVEGASQGVDVPGRRRLPGRLDVIGRKVIGRAHDLAESGVRLDVSLQRTGQPQVGELGVPIWRDQHVSRFHVAVD